MGSTPAQVRCLAVGVCFFLIPTLWGQTVEESVVPPDGLTRVEWSEIRAAHEGARYAVSETNTGFAARNPGQAWSIAFDGRGFLVQPDSGGWEWGLQLDSYGFEGHMQRVDAPWCASGEGARVFYDWNANVREWYVNGSSGLEHGYTIEQRPARRAGSQAPLVFDLEVEGPLRAEPVGNGSGIRFVDSAGATIVNYSGLHVFDAHGVTQPAKLFVEAGRVRIQVQEHSAKYPLTIDPIAQQAYLKASNTDAQDRFGDSVAVSGDRVVVGAMGEDSVARGVDGVQGNLSNDSGAAYVFRRVAGTWVQEAYLKASNSDPYDGFGEAVAISGDCIVVGASQEDSRGYQSDNSFPNSGAAYVFEYVGGAWIQRAYLKASNAETFDRFGVSVGISDSLVVVGAVTEASGAIGVNGNGLDNSAPGSGAAYVFERIGNTWGQQAYLKASNSESGDWFGFSVAASGEKVAIGAPNEDSDSIGVNGNQANNLAVSAGAVYVFARNGGVWNQEAYVKASNTESFDSFGGSVAISNDLVAVGATGEDSDATGINGNQFSNSADFRGAVYVFDFTGMGWSQDAYLKSSTGDGLGLFGYAVGVSGERVLVATWLEASGDTGVNGNQADNSMPSAGAAYLFERRMGVWNQQAFLKASNTNALDDFGVSAGISGRVVAVGAPSESSNARGVDGDQSDNSASSAGAVYVFDLDAPVASFCGDGIVNSTGVSGSLGFSGSLRVSDNAFRLQATRLPANVFGFYLVSSGQQFRAQWSGSQGTLCLGGGWYLHPIYSSLQRSNAVGELDTVLDLDHLTGPNQAASPGETWNFQCWYRDTNPGSTSNLTDGLSVRFE